MTTPIHARFSSASDAAMPASPNDYDQRQSLADPYDSAHLQGAFRRPSPDIEPSSADPLRAQFADYDADSNPGSRRESFIDSDLEMRKYQGLSASGVAGYQAVGPGETSEPGSPTQGEGYERSNESGSSGTKVDQTGRVGRPVTMSSDGSYDARDRGSGQAVSVRSSLFLLGDGKLTSPAVAVRIWAHRGRLQPPQQLDWLRRRRPLPPLLPFVWPLPRRFLRPRLWHRVGPRLDHWNRPRRPQHALQLVARRAQQRLPQLLRPRERHRRRWTREGHLGGRSW